MKIKVCGLLDPQNLAQIIELKPDYVGFIQHVQSKRFVEGKPTVELPSTAKSVAVFVNQSIDAVKEIQSTYGFDAVQLHGNESPEYCAALKRNGLQIIKAFQLHDRFEFSMLHHYAKHCDFFLFDTLGPLPGGNGKHFNWKVLDKYDCSTPFFLSGGIALADVERLNYLETLYPLLHAVDINSKFETAPGFKNVALLHSFFEGIRTHQNTSVA